MTTRRELMGAALGLAAAPAALAETQARSAAVRPLRILVLGGTGFIGPHYVRACVARGHKVATFNRGRRRSNTGWPEGVEQLTGDRNSDMTSVMGRDWDAVIDTPAILPRWVRNSIAALRTRTAHYTYISSTGVYDFDRAPPGPLSENGPLTRYTVTGDPFAAETFSGGEDYGAFKVINEQQLQQAFPGKLLVVRPALIVGPGDNSDRFTYWPVRMKQGGEILAPGAPNDPQQYIDVRDMAEWTVRMIERREAGTFNAVGPAMTLTYGEFLGGVRAMFDTPMRLTWAAADWLTARGLSNRQIPAWYRGAVIRIDNSRAVAAGATYRPLHETAHDTLAWFEARPPEERKLKAGWTLEQERETLAAWRASGA